MFGTDPVRLVQASFIAAPDSSAIWSSVSGFISFPGEGNRYWALASTVTFGLIVSIFRPAKVSIGARIKHSRVPPCSLYAFTASRADSNVAWTFFGLAIPATYII